MATKGPTKALLQAIAVTAELCGKTFSDASARVFAEDLADYPEQAVLAALSRCRKEVKGILSLQDVISRIEDGRPGVEEAWAMLPATEDQSVVWTEEMAQAWGIALLLLSAGDKIGARMAFKEAYQRLVTQARERGVAPRWTPSFGHDPDGRQPVITEAVRLNRLTLDHGLALLSGQERQDMLLSLGVTNHPLLAAPDTQGREKVKALLATLKPKMLPE